MSSVAAKHEVEIERIESWMGRVGGASDRVGRAMPEPKQTGIGAEGRLFAFRSLGLDTVLLLGFLSLLVLACPVLRLSGS